MTELFCSSAFTRLQPFRPVQLAPQHRLCRQQRVGQEEPASVPDALQELAGSQAGPAGQRGAPGPHTSQLQQHTHRTEAGEAGERKPPRETSQKPLGSMKMTFGTSGKSASTSSIPTTGLFPQLLSTNDKLQFCISCHQRRFSFMSEEPRPRVLPVSGMNQ